MFEPHHGKQSSSHSAPQSSAPTRSSVLGAPSQFVAQIVVALRGRKSDAAQVCAEHLSRRGALTGVEFSALVDTLPHPSQTTELVWAHSRVTREVLDVDFAPVLPAFLKLAHKCLIDSGDVSDLTTRSVARVFDRLLVARVHSGDVEEVIDVVVGDSERCLLQSILTRVENTRPGYWECVELLGALFPDEESLEGLLRAVERVGSGPHRRETLTGVRRTVAAVGAADFLPCAEFVGRALGDSQRIGDVALRRAAAEGLASHSVRRVDDLIKLLNSDDDRLSRFACWICVCADNEKVELDDAMRNRLADQLKIVRARFEHAPTGSILMEDPLIALGHISTQRSDIEEIGKTVQERLRRDEPVSSDLVISYAAALARLEKEDGVMALPTLSLKRFKSLDRNPPLKHSVEDHPRVITGKEIDYALELLALDVSEYSDFESVLERCREESYLLAPGLLSRRRTESVSLFSTGKQALQFARHHARLALEGPAEFAAALLPELLSALVYNRKAKKRGKGDLVAESALESLTSLARLAASDSKIRDLSLARLCSRDWEFLGRLHKINEKAFSRAHPELGLSAIALRAVLDDDTTWQKDLFEWWGTIPPRLRNRMEPNGLSFISVVAERGRPGTVWELLRRLPLASAPAYDFSDIGLALLANPEDSVSQVCMDILSEKGEVIGRALFFAQMLAPHCTDGQREHLRGAIKGLLDEVGILGVDAAVTLGSLSRTREDALLLLAHEPVLGFDERVYRVSCATAAAEILRNSEHDTLE